MKISKTAERFSGTGCIVFSDGTHLIGEGFGFEGTQVGELCFNTAMTGYQEIVTDPSYSGQIINFTFPHIGNTGANSGDNESRSPAALGIITRNTPTAASSWRSELNFNLWLKEKKIIGITNVDTRYLTRLARSLMAPNIAISFSKTKIFDLKKMKHLAQSTKGLHGKELTKSVTCSEPYEWVEIYNKNKKNSLEEKTLPKLKVAAIDYGAKETIFKCLKKFELELNIFPATVSVEAILQSQPDGIFLSNGPGDPEATFNKFGRVIKDIVLKTKIPIFGICLGHQLLGLALGADTKKMPYGHHGANHPVKDILTGKVEITSMNHGFAINGRTLPTGVRETHISLFDGSNCGIAVPERNLFGVQYHPEASPGPKDSYYLFKQFFDMMKHSRKVRLQL